MADIPAANVSVTKRIPIQGRDHSMQIIEASVTGDGSGSTIPKATFACGQILMGGVAYNKTDEPADHMLCGPDDDGSHLHFINHVGANTDALDDVIPTSAKVYHIQILALDA